MECGDASKQPRRAAEAAKYQMVTCELEAAEALAGLAGYSGELERNSHQQLVTEAAITSSDSSQDRAIAAQQFCGYQNERTVETRPSEQLCSTSSKSNFVSKLRPKLTEAEKEARKVRRILANRESARQTIRRRQDMYMELTRKAADLSEENENLKKEKELAVKEYNSVKDRNEFLKAQMAKLKKAEPGGRMQEYPTTSRAHVSSSETSNTPVFPYNQPSLVPCIWPSILPYTDVLQLQYPSHSNITNSSNFPKPEIPLFVVPVPWLLPFLPLCSHSDTNDTRNVHQSSTCSSSDTLVHEGNNQLSSNRNMRAEASNSTKAMAVGSVHGAGFALPRNSGGRESMKHRPLQKSKEPIICPLRKPEDVFAAVEARRRRKELMKLKNHNDQHN